MNASINSVAVIGAGTMGAGIALVSAQSGLKVTLVDVKTDQLERAKNYHRKTLDRSVEKQRITRSEADAVIARVTFSTSMGDSSSPECAIEAATEDMDLKKKIFGQMRQVFPAPAVLATNTSSISITEIAGGLGTDAGRVIGMHFFNPVPVVALVEVIRGLATNEDTLARTISLAKALGKTPVQVNDRAGFVSNRVLMPMINEAFFAWMEGVSGPNEIDQIMKLGCNFPMGPLRLADFIGLDVCHDIMMVLYRELGDEKFFPCPLLRQLVKAGRLGDKCGHGVYEFPAK